MDIIQWKDFTISVEWHEKSFRDLSYAYNLNRQIENLNLQSKEYNELLTEQQVSGTVELEAKGVLILAKK